MAPTLAAGSWCLHSQELPQDASLPSPATPAASLPLPRHYRRVTTSVKQFFQQATCGSLDTEKPFHPIFTGRTTIAQPATLPSSTRCTTSQLMASCSDAALLSAIHALNSQKAGQIACRAHGLGPQHTQHGSISKQIETKCRQSQLRSQLGMHGRKRAPKRAALE